MDNITVPLNILGIDGAPSIEFRLWIENITARSLIIGAGSPDGAVEATQGGEYMDTGGVAGAIKYIKKVNSIAGNKKLGWVLI